MAYRQRRVDLDHTAEQLNTLDEQTTSTGDLSIAGATTLSANAVYYSKIFAPGDGTIHLTQMFAVAGYTGHAKMAVYADNGSGTAPSGAALAVSAEIVNPPAGINIFVFDNSVAVSSFQQLWLAFQTDTARAWRPNTAPPGDSQGTQAQAYGAFPSANIGATLGPNFHFGEIVVTPLLGRGNVFPTTFRYGLMSLWFEPMSNAGVEWSGGQALDASTTAVYGMTVRYDTSEDPFGPGYGLVTIGVSTGSASGSSVTFRAADNVNGTACNIVASIDAVGQVAQCLFNGTLLTPLTSTWVSTDPIATGHMLLTAIIAEIHYGLDRAEFCIADLYADAPASFFDLSIAGNQLKFISGSGGTPTDLGSDASSVTGSVPIAYYRVRPGGVGNDLATNNGIGGGNLFNPFANLTLCGVLDVAVADLWFGKTADFVDLDSVANRRKFIDETGAPVILGADGSRPFGAAPQVFFSRAAGASADSFAVNRGNGGGFTLIGGGLGDAASAPSCSTEVTTVFTPGSAGLGVVGDYRNGNLYAFNMDTLQDNGSPRKWVRAWRALIKPVRYPVSFGSLTIDMQTGAEIAPGAVPAIMLRWSDDGGHTWSQPRIMKLAPLGGTAYRVKANRLGSTRLTSGLDRIWELSSRDPFKVALLGASMDAS